MNKKLFKEISDCFNKDLTLMENEMKSLFLEEFSNVEGQGIMSPLCLNAEFQKEALNFLFNKSKRLRPLAIFMIKDLLNFEDKENKLIKLAAALELLHSATLVHDDIIDEAKVRRSLPAFNFKYNSKIAVILGDYLLSLSLKLLSEIGSAQVFSYFSENTLNICKGEINQFFDRGKPPKMEEYIQKSKDKTSSLFLAGAKSALHLINEKQTVENSYQNAILDYILNFSLGFQIYDDILNFKSDFENPLKPNDKASSDIKNGIYTICTLYMIERNYLCDIMNLNKEQKFYKEALEFSNNYLNNTLKKAQNSIEQLKNIYNTEFFIKLANVFKIEGNE